MVLKTDEGGDDIHERVGEVGHKSGDNHSFLAPHNLVVITLHR